MEDSLEILPSTPLSPTGGMAWRPSLAVLFHQFRRSSDRDYLTKEDLREVFADASELDEAFAKLDSDGNGRITLEEFMAGFATFLRQTQSGGAREDKSDTSPRTDSGFRRSGSTRRSARRRPIPEIYFESDTTSSKEKPGDTLTTSIKPLSSQTKKSIEQLWCSLNSSNPELVGDFEEFIRDMSTEVESAQKALKKQREVTNKEAMELDEEMERMQSHTQYKLEEQTAILREKAQSNQSKLEEQLYEKEQELSEIKSKLQLLESEIIAGKQNQAQLQQKYESAFEERDELSEQLERSDKLLRESQNAILALKKEANQNVERQRSIIEEHESALSQIESNYSKEINELKERLMFLQQQQQLQQEQQELQQQQLQQQQHELQQQQQQQQLYIPLIHTNSDDDLIIGGDTRPDLLSAHQDIGRANSPGSLLNEIVETEGTASPVLKDTMIHTTSFEPSHPLALKELDHLDLALNPTTPTSTAPHILSPPSINQSNVQLRPRSARNPRSRPTSLYASHPDYPANLDLNWPPGNWPVPPQEWLAAIAAATITTRQENGYISHDKEEPVPSTPPAPRPTPNTTSLEEVRGTESIQPKHKDPELCKPLEFVESLLVKPDLTFKILIVGNPHVGKSCFLTKLCTNTFTTRYASTIGVDFYSRVLTIDDQLVSLQLWDTAGQERFQSVTKAYYRGAQGVILMYDIAREESFIAVKSWINSIQENVDELPTSLLLVGNKVDLDEYNKREVLYETGETFSKIYGAQFIETSAKTGYNVGNACLTLVKNLILENKFSTDKTNGIPLDNTENKSRCSC